MLRGFRRVAGFLAVLALVGLVAPSHADQDSPDADSLAQVARIIGEGVTRNWNRPAEAPATDPRIRVRLNRDGSLDGAPQIENPSDDPAFEAYAESAIRVIVRAAPFDLAGHGKTYDRWKLIVLPFSSESGRAAQETPTAAVLAADAPTSANLLRNFRANGMEAHAVTFYREMENGTPLVAMAMCGVGSNDGNFVLSVDFGEGPTWREPETVDVRVGS